MLDFRSEEGVDTREATFAELVALAQAGSGEVLAVGRKITKDAEGVLKAWESSSSAERVVQEVALEGTGDSGRSSRSRLVNVLATVPVNPSW